eukprot:CAMPEP_0203845496 /NCGR_PEP_ID=MMETSP0359-20131031/3846_1 /ASSEMBLY_ACC=CAM_ASM_000338 /TAXON_ID=268821 /ORGANISM="Scrippsiella Hangoei, Strain SHTV-5" /LENGTH=116 /DNA_ID=CAMNT_0050760635 /DNA_START=44 /DNA_END=391 /DNA_ORIENTATION=-
MVANQVKKGFHAPCPPTRNICRRQVANSSALLFHRAKLKRRMQGCARLYINSSAHNCTQPPPLDDCAAASRRLKIDSSVFGGDQTQGTADIHDICNKYMSPGISAIGQSCAKNLED